MENENKIEDVHQLIEDIQIQLSKLKQMLATFAPADFQRALREKAAEVGSIGGTHSGTIIEGVFDGQNMVGPDGKIYTVPANYASKSKLIEGDILKLTILDDGSFIYKQIGPVKRRRIVATLVRDDATRTFRAVTGDGRSFRLLLASVTYYKGEPNDDVVILVPSSMDSRWAAVENVVKNMSDEERRYYEAENSEEHDDEENVEYDDHERPMLDAGDDHLLSLGDEGELPSDTAHSSERLNDIKNETASDNDDHGVSL